MSLFVLFSFSISGATYALDNISGIDNKESFFRKSILTDTSGETTELFMSNSNSRAVSQSITYYIEKSTNDFPDYFMYDDGEYEGLLTKTGAAFVSSGSYTPSDTKYVYGTKWNDRPVWEYESFSGLQESPRIYGSDGTVVSNKFNQLGSLGLSYRSSWTWDGSSGQNPTENYSDSDGYNGVLTVLGTQENGRYLVDLSTQYWDYPACNKGEPKSKIKVYTRTDKVKLEGYVTKPAVDTRVYKQAYTGIIKNKDAVAPSVTPVVFDWDSSDVVPIFVEATDTGGSGLASIELYDSSNKLLMKSNTSPLIYMHTPTVEGITNLYVYAEDKAGNRSTDNSNIQIKIDKTKPSASFSPTSKTWTKSNIPVTINVSDNLSGVKSWRYAISSNNGSTWGTWKAGSGTTGTVTISTDGISKIKVEVTDNAGNTNIITSGSYQIDKTKPSLRLSPNGRPWNNTSVTANMTPLDTGGSGVASWTYRLSSNGGGTWGSWTTEQPISGTTVTFSGSGEWVIEAKITDNVGNTNTVTSNTYFVDNVKPSAKVYTAPTTTSRNISIYLDDISDLFSGVKEVIVGNYENDASAVVHNISNQTNIVLNFELDKKNTVEEHYSERFIYVSLKDNANNIKTYVISTTLLPKPTGVPTIVNPLNDALFLPDEKIPLVWTYADDDTDFSISPKKFEIIIKDKTSNAITKYEVNGSERTFNIYDLSTGSYDISVKCYVSDTIYSESSPVLVRIGKFKSSGNVKTTSILPGSKIRYVAISTESEIPEGTTITGKIYYKSTSSNALDKNISVPFTITKDYKSNIIKLPEYSAKIEVEYFLKSNSSKDQLSPLLDSIVVFAR